MAIHYRLVPNKLLEDPNAYTARVQAIGTADIEHIIEEICLRETTVGEPDVRSVLTLYFQVIERLVQEGLNVISPLAYYRATIKGVFNRASDGFDPGRHELMPLIIPSKRLRRALRDVSVVKEERRDLVPLLEDFVDVDSGEVNAVATPGGMAQLTGRRLRFDPEDPEQGIFFIGNDGSAVQVEKVGKNMLTEVFFIIPALSPGDYRLEARASVNESEDVRVGVLKATLTVSA